MQTNYNMLYFIRNQEKNKEVISYKKNKDH